MSQGKAHAIEVQKKTAPARPLEQEVTRQPEQEPVQLVAPQMAYRRAQVSRNGLRAVDVLALQRTVGNRVVRRMMARRTDRADGQQQPEQASAVTPDLEARLQVSAGKGSLLRSETRALMKPRLEDDLGQVRVHTDNEAAEMNSGLQAQAFTHKQHSFFGNGEYRTKPEEGKQLLAHELTHVVKQIRRPMLQRSHGQVAPRQGFRVCRKNPQNPKSDLIIYEQLKTGDDLNTFAQRVFNKYLYWRFRPLPSDLYTELMKIFDEAPREKLMSAEEAKKLSPGEDYYIIIENLLEQRIVRRYAAWSSKHAEEKETQRESSKEAKDKLIKVGQVSEGGQGEQEEVEATEETKQKRNELPPEVRDFYAGTKILEDKQISTEELLRMQQVFNVFVRGKPKWGSVGQSFKAWVSFFVKNMTLLKGEVAATETGKLTLDVLENLMKRLEEGQPLEFSTKEEKELAEKAHKAREVKGLPKITGQPEWLLIPAEDRKLILGISEKYPDLLGGEKSEVKRVTSSVKRTLALQLALKHLQLSEELKTALIAMAEDPEFWTVLAGSIGLYVALWLAPEAVFTKALAAGLTAYLIATLAEMGIESTGAIVDFAVAWVDLDSACRYDAETVEKLDEVAKNFADKLGKAGSMVMLLIASWLIGKTIKAVERGAGKLKVKVKGESAQLPKEGAKRPSEKKESYKAGPKEEKEFPEVEANVRARRLTVDGHHEIRVTEDSIICCSPGCPFERSRYPDELKQHPQLDEQLRSAENKVKPDPEGAADQAQAVDADLAKVRRGELLKSQADSKRTLEGIQDVLNTNPELKGEYGNRLGELNRKWEEAFRSAEGAKGDPDLEGLAKEEFESLDQQIKALESEAKPPKLAKPVEAEAFAAESKEQPVITQEPRPNVAGDQPFAKEPTAKLSSVSIAELEQQYKVNEQGIEKLDKKILKKEQRRNQLYQEADRILSDRKTSNFGEEAAKLKKKAATVTEERDALQRQRNILKSENERIRQDIYRASHPVGPKLDEPHGGAYEKIPTAGGHVHHIPADASSPLSTNKGPCIWMEEADHGKTNSWGGGVQAQQWRAIQEQLIKEGKFHEAVQMDIDDIRAKFGNKYEKGIQEMLDYIDTLDPKDLLPKK